MKYRFIDITQFVFCGGQSVENKLSGLLDQLNHCFIYFTKVAFCDNQKAEKEF
jgi:hypothetical protein